MLRKNPLTREPLSTMYKTLAKTWTKHPVHSKIFQNVFVQEYSTCDKEPMFVLGKTDTFVQLIKLVAHITNYKEIIWIIAEEHEKVKKQVLIELDLTTTHRLFFSINPVEAMSLKFDEGVLVIFDHRWKLVHYRCKVKTLVIQPNYSTMPSCLDPHNPDKKRSAAEIIWVETDNFYEKTKELVQDIETHDEGSVHVLVSNSVEERKMKKVLRKYSATVGVESIQACITIDTGHTYCQEYYYPSRTYVHEKRLLYQDQLQDRAGMSNKLHYLLLTPGKVLKRRDFLPKPVYAETLQLLSKYSARSIEKLISSEYSPLLAKHSFKTLYYLEALDSKGCLTSMGQKMLALPTDPQISRMLVKHGRNIPCTFYLAAALHLSGDLQDWFLGESPHHEQWVDNLGDHLSLLGLIEQYHAMPKNERAGWCLQHQVNYDLLSQCGVLADDFATRLGLEANPDKACEVREAILDSFFLQTLITHEGSLWSLGNTKPLLCPPNVPDGLSGCMVCSKVTIYKRSEVQFMATPCTKAELQQIVPKYFIARRFKGFQSNLFT
jgi:hypothetical protein